MLIKPHLKKFIHFHVGKQITKHSSKAKCQVDVSSDKRKGNGALLYAYLT